MKTELEVKDLRIGNLISWKSLPNEVDEVKDLRTAKLKTPIINNVSIKDVEPIPLTEDWLIKSNLEKRRVQETDEDRFNRMKGIKINSIPYNEYSIRNDFDIYCYMDQSGNCLIYGECHIGKDFFIIKCDKVYEFQNIFKVLANKELTINEN